MNNGSSPMLLIIISFYYKRKDCVGGYDVVHCTKFHLNKSTCFCMMQWTVMDQTDDKKVK